MSYIGDFIKEYEEIQNSLLPHFESNLKGFLKEISYNITHEKFAPSEELKNFLKNLAKKSKERLKLVIIGARDSGKATLINIILKTHILPNNLMYDKKTYLISYGYTRSIIAYYKNKTAIGLNTLSLHSLTQEELDKIDYFEIKFPIPLLKEFDIYKCPDIDLDDEENIKILTEKITQSDILIWLNRVDDLANTEEFNVFKPYIIQKTSTSLCVLTHIDILEKSEDIIPTFNFAKEHFARTFSEIFPLSTMIIYKELGIDEQFFIQKELQKLYYHYSDIQSQDFNQHEASLIKAFEDGIKNIELFYKNPLIIPKDLQNQKVNLNVILDHLNLILIPKAKKLKEELIYEEILTLLTKINKNYTAIISIYSKFSIFFQSIAGSLLETIKSTKDKTFEELELFFKNLHSDRNNIIKNILENIHPQKIKISLQNPNFLQMLKGKKEFYTTYQIDSQTILQELLNPKSRSYRTYKALHYKFTKLISNIHTTLEKSITDFSAGLKKWQAQYELIKKKESILSDFNYNNLRIFASKIYENFGIDYIESILEANKEIQISFSKLHAHLESTRELSIKYTLSILIQKFYEDSHQASLHYTPKASLPTQEELNKLINESFSIDHCSDIVLKNEGSLNEIFEELEKNITILNQEKTISIEKKIDDLQSLQKIINNIYNVVISKKNII
ncbi:hypothetical protein [Helicobacter sp. 11S03491-1]|uniref:hypothetical protein n=1 Tax=Helicobacter sp. 11S03491-1 TaxID=1476196 RepID=UPI000BA73B7B|nr:hypothetical protein [Helicobacter sp. 11S03491-1]PAF41726.1 hypothetical protein BKH45_06465 [Helicobacter sp. 11S03491-1]